jgi:1,4-dihydroxy-6-naphthoate synthase
MKTYTLGFSPCPNDTFIFDALVNKKIDTEGIAFEAVLEDVETLNEWALQGKLDISKLSFPAFFQSIDKYVLLNAGSALGKGVGPLLVSKFNISGVDEESLRQHVNGSLIAIPGINTTANLLLRFAFPEAIKKTPMLFSAIEDAVCTEKVTMGLIIHENRFTYEKKGLHKVIDLGEYWEKKMKGPIPLGGIAARRAIPPEIIQKVDHLIRRSLDHAFVNYPLITDYVKMHSQAMSEEVMRKHIDLYVNNFSLDLGEEGQKAILELSKCFFDIQGGSDYTGSQSLFI